jgi:uncharacterized membrane protein YuzA (DUF378 family)
MLKYFEKIQNTAMDVSSMILTAVGGLNVGVNQWFDFDLVDFALGKVIIADKPLLVIGVTSLIGVAAIYQGIRIFKGYWENR